MARRLPASLLLLIACVSFAAAQVKQPQRIRVSAGVEAGLLEAKVDPVYPPLARQARIQGTVVLKVTISKTGEVEHVDLDSGHPMLAPAAIEAVKQWKYKPFLLNGNPLVVETTVEVNFTLADHPPAQGVAGDQPGGIPDGQIGSVLGGIAPSTPDNGPRPAVPQRVRVSSGVMAGLLERKVNPTYPPDAKDQHIQGVVVLKVNIDKEGNVYKVELISGHPLLAPAAIEAVKQWKYRPYLLNQIPVEVETQVQVNFTLAN